MKTLATMSALLIGAMLASAQTAEELTTQEVFNGKNGAKLLYRQYVPKDLAPDAKIPLVLFLHGAGERGDDNTAQLKHGVGAIIKYSQEKQMPFAMLVPQCPNNQMWVNKPWGATSHHMDKSPTGNLAMVLSLLKEKITSLPIDPNRVYVTGISMGGYGTWEIIQREPTLFAAAIPICGGGDTREAWRIRDLPIWVFHGDADMAVPVERSRAMVTALWGCGGHVYYREYPNMNHDVWTRTYNDREVLDWLFKQKRR